MPRLIERAVLFAVVTLTLLVTAGTSRDVGVTEGNAEETVHAAAQYASFSVTPGGAGAGEQDDDEAPVIVEPVASHAALPATASGAQALRTDSPSSPARYLPAARGPPSRR